MFLVLTSHRGINIKSYLKEVTRECVLDWIDLLLNGDE
jgi:hypothetical protein